MFDFEPGLMFWTIVSFLLFLFIIQKYVLPPLAKILAERQELINKSIEESARSKTEAADLLQKGKAELQRVYQQAEEYSRQAQLAREELQKKQLAEWQETLNDLKQKQQKELQRAEETVIAQVQKKIGNYIASACEKIIEKDLPTDIKNKIIENDINNLENLEL